MSDHSAAGKCPFQFDLMNAEKMSHGVPFEAFKTLREKCPVALQDSAKGPYWAITKRDEVDFISKNPELFSSSINLAHPQPGGNDDKECVQAIPGTK